MGKVVATFLAASFLVVTAYAAGPVDAPPAPAPLAGKSAAAIPAALPTPPGNARQEGSAPATAGKEVKVDEVITVTMFMVIIAVTLFIVVWAARGTKTAADFYAAGGGVTGTQNGWAIAGDYMSAASLLGITGLISVYGYDGFMYSTGWLVAYVTVLLVIAEPCRNAGRYTLGDIVSFRTEPKSTRAVAALATVTISIIYLTAQMVGAGRLMQLLIGIPYKAAIIGVGTLMVGYVVFGGMKATTWVQIIKAVLLMAGAVLLSLLVAVKSGLNPLRFFNDIVSSKAIQDHVRMVLLRDPLPVPGFDYGQRFLEPGLFLKNPLDQISLGMALVLGTAGMPHILMRFFTVPTAQAARKSTIVAMLIIGTFFILTTLLGFGAAIHVTPQSIQALDKGGNMATLMLAQQMGTEIAPVVGELFLAFFCAVAFATILAVVSGLVLAASAAIAHDIYVNVLKDGHADQHEQVMAARITSMVVSIAGIGIGIAAEQQNIAHLVALAFAVAASGNLPVVFLSLFWKKFSTGGVIAGLVVGTISSIGLVMVSPTMTYPKLTAAAARKVVVALERKQSEGVLLAGKDVTVLETARQDYTDNRNGTSLLGLDKPLFPLKNPGIVSVPLGFLAAILGALAFPSRRSEAMFDEIYVRQNTGIGVARVADH
jgi:cation/acetate symporter